MLTSSWTVDERSDEAILGWRSWRLLPFETLDGAQTFRLCACGTQGIPKLWQPRRAVEAVCSDFRAGHEAPWPDHECGLYAYRERERALEHLQAFLGFEESRAGVAGWALGYVSLWGRVIEHEDGWRAQYAYPFAITVHAAPEVARTIRDAYRIEVDVAEPLLVPEEDKESAAAFTPARSAEIRSTLARMRAELTEMEDELDETEPDPRAPSHRYAHGYGLTDDDLLYALNRTLGKQGRSAALAAEIAEEYAEGDRSLPLSHCAVDATAIELKRASLAGLVVQYRRGGSYGTSLWGLPGGEPPAGYEQAVDKHAEFDKATLAALRKATKKQGGEVRIGAVLEELGYETYSKAEESQVAQSLVRLNWRKQATAASGHPRKWTLR
jgi:hypothetical protein